MDHTMPTERKRLAVRPSAIGRALLLITGFVLLLGLFGAVYQQLAQRRLAAAFPPPGRLVTVDGRHMHIVCQGEGEPTVILDAGQGGWSSDWQTLMPSLAQERRVCAYDRAGYGWSQAAGDDRSPAASAHDLAQLLAAADIEPPYLLVAFSRSGLAARIFAAEHREQLAGLILVDPATEYDNELLGEQLLRQQQAAVPVFQTFRLAASIGLLHLLGTENMAGSAPFIATTHPDPALYYGFIANPGWWTTSVKEFRSGFNADHLQQVQQAWAAQRTAVDDLPLVIIASDQPPVGESEAMEQLQVARQLRLAEVAQSTSRGCLRIAKGSSHNVPADRPDVIIDAVQSLGC